MKSQIKITLLTFALFFVSFLDISAQTYNSTTKSLVPSSTMEIDQTTYEFGEVTEGEKVEHVFTFKNTGDQPLIITSAKGSCGCTVPQWPKEAIAPGDVASFTVIFNSKNKKGPRNQKVTLVANTNPSTTYVYLKGKVNPRNKTDEMEAVEVETQEDSKISKDCFVIFPNPTSEVLNIKMNDELVGKSVIVSVFSESAQLMAQRSIEQVGSNESFNVSHFPRGTYFANVQVDGVKAQSICFVISD